MSNRSDEFLDACEIESIDHEKLARIRARMETDEHLSNLADLFNALGTITRVKILYALSLEELCVCDIAALVGVSPSAVSHQLRLLRLARLVKARKHGKMTFYSLDDEHVRSLIKEGLEHVHEG